MRIHGPQIVHMGAVGEAAFKKSLPDHVREYFPTVADVCGPAGIERIVDAAMNAAHERGFVGRASARSYLDMALLLGADFATDPLLGFAAPHLDWARAREALRVARGDDPAWPRGVVADDDEPDPIDMLEGLYNDAWKWLDMVAGDNFVHLYKALVRLRRMLDAPPAIAPDDAAALAALCETVYPEKAEGASPAAMTAFFAETGRRARLDGVGAGAGVAVYAAHCFIGGVGAFRDPAFAIGERRLIDLPEASDARAVAYAAFVGDYIDLLLASARRHAADAA